MRSYGRSLHRATQLKRYAFIFCGRRSYRAVQPTQEMTMEHGVCANSLH